VLSQWGKVNTDQNQCMRSKYSTKSSFLGMGGFLDYILIHDFFSYRQYKHAKSLACLIL
jgi:hypothetical protein